MSNVYRKTKKEILQIIKVLNTGTEQKDFSGIKHISTSGCTLIKVYSEKEKHCLSNYTFNPNVKGFLENQGFFSDEERCITATNILPFLTINDSHDVDVHTENLKDIMKTYIPMNPKLLNTISTIIGELLQNIYDHSGINNDPVYNYVAGHYMSGVNNFKIAITDSGQGIFASLRKKHTDIVDAGEAIEKALIPKMSGGRTFDKETGLTQEYTVNRGLGLSKTIEAIRQLGGDLFIGTKDYLYCFSNETGKELIKLERGEKWLGTFVIFNISSNSGEGVDIDKIDRDLMNQDNQSIDNSKDIDNMFL